jgi:prevent-host-death family protein
MTMQPTQLEPCRVDEPQEARAYADVLSRVASEHQPVIIRRDGADLAVVIPIEHLELFEEMLARQQAERLASQIDWDRLVKTNPPPQDWFDGDEPKPF